MAALSRALRAVGKFAEAMEAGQKALTLRPHKAVLFSNIGTNQLSLGQLDAAVDNFRRAIELQPDLVPAHHNLSHALLTLGHMHEG